MGEKLTVSREIAAPAETLYAMVSDVTRMGEWSPENEGGEWLGDAHSASPGARFRATNRAGSKSWKTVAKVVDADPGRRFAFCVTFGPLKVAEWSYNFEPTATGCRVSEVWNDLRPGWFKPLSRMGTGVKDRESHNRQGMEETLARLAAAAESAARSG
jgi:uncharacterized protein YndB with AHSA1/START domain